MVIKPVVVDGVPNGLVGFGSFFSDRWFSDLVSVLVSALVFGLLFSLCLRFISASNILLACSISSVLNISGQNRRSIGQWIPEQNWIFQFYLCDSLTSASSSGLSDILDWFPPSWAKSVSIIGPCGPRLESSVPFLESKFYDLNNDVLLRPFEPEPEPYSSLELGRERGGGGLGGPSDFRDILDADLSNVLNASSSGLK